MSNSQYSYKDEIVCNKHKTTLCDFFPPIYLYLVLLIHLFIYSVNMETHR